MSSSFPGPSRKFLVEAARIQTVLSGIRIKPLLAAWRRLYGLPYQGSAEVTGTKADHSLLNHSYSRGQATLK